jgi:hypothetical protein
MICGGRKSRYRGVSHPISKVKKGEKANLETPSPTSDQAVERDPDVLVKDFAVSFRRVIIAHNAIQRKSHAKREIDQLCSLAQKQRGRKRGRLTS